MSNQVFLLCKQDRNASIQPVATYADEGMANTHCQSLNKSNADRDGNVPALYMVIPHTLVGNPRYFSIASGFMTICVMLMAASGGWRIGLGTANPFDYPTAACGLILLLIVIKGHFRPKGDMA